MTERLFDREPYGRSFSASVLSIREEGGRFAAVLDRTLFFPEEGGQLADRGTINGISVLDVKEKDGEIVHFLPEPLSVGTEAQGEIDFACRYERMQTHTSEHILSGIAHRLWSMTNVGFHLREVTTLDYDKPLTEEMLATLEQEANRAVFANLPVRAYYPEADALAAMSYRSKKALSGAVRIVEIEGVDTCACCAPHVARTGEVGLIHILRAEHYKGGMRLWICAGWGALRAFRRMDEHLTALSRMLSVPTDACVEAVERLRAELDAERGTVSVLRRRRLEDKVASAAPKEEIYLDFDDQGAKGDPRLLVNACLPKAPRLCGAFLGADGEGYSFVLASDRVDLTALSQTLRAETGARLGGSPRMVSGFVHASKDRLTALLTSLIP